MDAADVGRGLLALLDCGFIDGTDCSDYGTPQGQIELGAIRLAPRGRVHVKQWPGDDAAGALLGVLDDLLASSGDPEEQSALKAVKGGLRGLPSRLLTEIAVGYAKRLSGLE